MAQKKKINIYMGLDDKELRQKLDSANSYLSKTLKTMGGTLGGLALGISAKEIADFAVNAASSLEQTNVSFGVMLGNEEKAKKLVQDLQTMASTTPLETADLADSSKLLLNFGEELENLLPMLRMLGDVSGGNAEKMMSLSRAFGKTLGNGRLMGEELNMMIDAGFNPLETMSERTGKSVAKLRDEMSRGKISVDMVRQSFVDATSEGGRFYQMMEKQSQTLEGLKSTKSDNLTLWAQNITNHAMPALKEFEQVQIDAIAVADAQTTKLFEWMDVNKQTTGAIQDAAVALAALAVGIPATNAAITTIIASVRSLGVVTANTTAFQMAFNSMLRGDSLLALTQYRAGMAALGVQIRATTAAMLACPITWVTLALGTGAAAWYSYSQAAQEGARAVESLNNAHEQQINKTSDAISTIKELIDQKNLDYAQTQKLEGAIDYLTEKYPEYAGELIKELKLKKEITKETLRMVAADALAAKTKGLDETAAKIENDWLYKAALGIKKIIPGMEINTAADKWIIEPRLNSLDKIYSEKLEVTQKYARDLAALEKTLGVDDSQGKNKRSKVKTDTGDDKAVEKARKEALNLRLAMLDAELLKTRNNAEEEYKIELQKINAKLQAEKQGTAAYQNLLNERTRLEQKYQSDLAQMDLNRINRKTELENLSIEREKSQLEAQRNDGLVSDEDYYEKLQEFEDRKYSLKLQSLEKQELLYQWDTQKMDEIEHEKLMLTAEYELRRQELSTERIKEEAEEWKKLTESLRESFRDSLSEFFEGNQSLKESFLSVFADIKAAFTQMVASMIIEQTKLALIGNNGLLPTLASRNKGGFWGMAIGGLQKLLKFETGGVVPGDYSTPVPIVAHGSEMVLNPMQQGDLWNLIQNAGNVRTLQTPQNSNSGNVFVFNQSFQSLDPAQGQKLFQQWMNQSGLSMVRGAIKDNRQGMRDTIRNV